VETNWPRLDPEAMEPFRGPSPRLDYLTMSTFRLSGWFVLFGIKVFKMGNLSGVEVLCRVSILL